MYCLASFGVWAEMSIHFYFKCQKFKLYIRAIKNELFTFLVFFRRYLMSLYQWQKDMKRQENQEIALKDIRINLSILL